MCVVFIVRQCYFSFIHLQRYIPLHFQVGQRWYKMFEFIQMYFGLFILTLASFKNLIETCLAKLLNKVNPSYIFYLSNPQDYLPCRIALSRNQSLPRQIQDWAVVLFILWKPFVTNKYSLFKITAKIKHFKILHSSRFRLSRGTSVFDENNSQFAKVK